ncbi:MAG: hypothetical protein ACR2G0_11845 [Chthoniobacterales bacterium]
MKTITVDAKSVGIAAAVLIAAVGFTWALAQNARKSDIRGLRKQVLACEERSSASMADSARSMRLVHTSMAEKEQEISGLQAIKAENEKLRKDNEEKDQQLAEAKDGADSRGGLHASHKTSSTPIQTFALGPGEERDLIPRVLKVKIDTFDQQTVAVTYGGHDRHLKVGEQAMISYLGRRCVLGLTKVEGSGDSQKASFSFSVMEPNRWRGRALATTNDPDADQ